MSDAETKTMGHLQEIRAAVADCEEALAKLARTCCMAARSARMSKLGNEVKALAQVSRLHDGKAAIPVDMLDAGVAQVERVGGALGELYATCCTASREKLYISMFKSVFVVHTNLWRLKGVDH